MNVVDPVLVQHWRAELALEFEWRDGRTVLARRRHEGPLVVQKPLHPEGGSVDLGLSDHRALRVRLPHMSPDR